MFSATPSRGTLTFWNISPPLRATPVAAGGPAPRSQETVVVRWLGSMNYEIAYRSNVFLVNAYFDRLPHNHPIGVTTADVKKATAILIGHAHFDHMGSAADIGRQTGGTVVGASFGLDPATKAGLPASQFRSVKDNEMLSFVGVTIEPVLARHSNAAALAPAACGSRTRRRGCGPCGRPG